LPESIRPTSSLNFKLASNTGRIVLVLVVALASVNVCDIDIISDVTIGADNEDVVLPLRLVSTMFLLDNKLDHGHEHFH
jgi:hypothetical protein